MKLHINYIILATDLLLYVAWFGFFIYLFVEDDRFELYYGTHRFLLGHLLATLTFIRLTEGQYYHEQKKTNMRIPYKPTSYWWLFAVFTFAIILDGLNLFVVIFKLPHKMMNIYVGEIVFASLYFGLAVIMWLWFKIKF